jgi:hypothetical protein
VEILFVISRSDSIYLHDHLEDGIADWAFSATIVSIDQSVKDVMYWKR